MARNEKLTLTNLRLLDGGVIDVAFQREMARAISDCQDRPSLDKTRQVSIIFMVKPKPDPHSPTQTADEVVTQVEIHSNIPKRRTKVYTMRTKHDNTATFHPDSPDDPDEDLMFDEEQKKKDDEDRKKK